MLRSHWLSHPLARLDRRPILVLSVITLIAAGIRFFRLTAPCLWGDEAEVYWRTCGTFGQLLDCLRTDGFSPLHYEMHWVIGRAWHVKPTPLVLRLVPALCGTLMVPAIYFLARQVVDRTTSLLAAAITACSAFLLFYSRDAKMYAEAWLMVTLTVGCMLWWFRKPTWTRWLCWVAAGCAAVGVQMASTVAIGVSLLLLLTQARLHWRRGLAWIAGVAVVMSGPAVYFGIFNQFAAKASDNYQADSGLAWVDMYNHGRTGPQMARFLGTTWAFGWEWPQDRQTDHIPGKVLKSGHWCAIGIGVVLAIGLIPWPRRWRPVEGVAPQARWRSLLWILLWIAVPTYGFYCYSKHDDELRPDFAVPTDWLHAGLNGIGFWSHPWPWSVLAGLVVIGGLWAGVWFSQVRRPFVRAIVSAAVVLLVLTVLEAMGRAMRPLGMAAAASDHPWHSLWVPRYLSSVLPAVIIAMAALLMRLPTIYLRTLAVVAVLSINLAFGAVRIFGQTEPPTDRMAADYYAAVTSDHQTITWFTNPAGGIGPGGGQLYSEPGRYYFQLLANKPMSPDGFKTSLDHMPIDEGFWHKDRWFDMRPQTYLPRLAARYPNANTIIVWDHDTADETAPPDALLPKLPGWHLQPGDTWYLVHDFWTGAEDYKLHRTEYVRN